jgi:peptide chain release factor 2
VMRERDALDDQLAAIGRIEQELDDQLTMIELGESEKDEKAIADAEAALKRLRAEVARRELEALLSGEADANDCYLEVHAGAGGTESQDWAGMLMRMYVRWAEAHGYKVEWIEESEGEGAGLKSATVMIKGHNAYGWLKNENGVHRLVRISPFDANARRHTSFASVVIFPVVDDRIKIDIDEKDVRTDVMRSGGAGGQHVNKTESAVRLTHIPTNIVVKCQQDRSQHRNRAMAWDMLRAKLFEAEIKKREAKAEAEQAAKTDIGWGHQIRSYVLQPYQMVKDLRTGVSTSDTGGVLDGDLDEFMQAALAQKAFGGGPVEVEDVE